MFNIFRRIRMGVLSFNTTIPSIQASHFSKRIFYTISEIIHVVIGVLTALQINKISKKAEQLNTFKLIDLNFKLYAGSGYLG